MTTNQERAAELLYNEGCGSGDTAHYIARRLADAGLLTPDPQPRTLADMTHEERKACQWMQADFTETEYWHVITAVAGEKSWLLRQEDGSSFEVPNSQITPLPDLPRLTWPEVEATEETIDLPEPEMDIDRLIWRVDEEGFVYRKPDGRISTIGVGNPYPSMEIAQRHALAVLAATNHYTTQEKK